MTGAKEVWIGQAGEGAWEKRMCTLNLCFSPALTGPQPRAALIFRGQGLRISDAERAAWHKDVDVSFNEKAWANDAWCLEHIPKQLAPVVPGVRGAEALLLCDNLSGQCSSDFRKLLKTKHNVLVWNLQPGTTDITQPVDSGYGRAVKRLIGVKLSQCGWRMRPTLSAGKQASYQPAIAACYSPFGYVSFPYHCVMLPNCWGCM